MSTKWPLDVGKAFAWILWVGSFDLQNPRILNINALSNFDFCVYLALNDLLVQIIRLTITLKSTTDNNIYRF